MFGEFDAAKAAAAAKRHISLYSHTKRSDDRTTSRKNEIIITAKIIN